MNDLTFVRVRGKTRLEWLQIKLMQEQQSEDKSGASTRGNSISDSVF